LGGAPDVAEPVLQISTKAREGLPQGFAEAVATFGLVGTILGSLRFRPEATPTLVGLYIAAASGSLPRRPSPIPP